MGRVHASPSSDRMWFGGAGLRFDGSSYAAFANDPRVFAGDEVSVFASIVPTAFGPTHDDSAIFTKGAAPHTLYFTVGAGRLAIYSEGNASWLDGSGSVPLNARSVVGFTKGSEGRRLWLNGRLDASDGVNSGLFWGPAGGRIGFRQDGFGAGYQGLIEWVAFWNRSLLPGEVGQVARLAGTLALPLLPMRLTRTVAVPVSGPVVFRRTWFDRAGSRGSG